MMQKIFSQAYIKFKKVFDNNSVLVFILVLVVMGACLYVGLSQSVWFDEAYSIIVSKKSFGDIATLVAADVHPPVYYWLLHIWGSVFGWGELALRSMSVLFFGLSLGIAGVFIKRLFNKGAVLFVLPFLALSPILFRYGFEIRMYSLASFVGILATYFLYYAVTSAKKPTRNKYMFAYAVLVALGVYTLYYLALLWFAHLAWLIYREKGHIKAIIGSDWLKAYVLSFVLFLPWLPSFIKQISNGALAQISQPMNVDNMIGVISFNFLYRPVWQLDALFSLATILIIGLIIYISIVVYRSIGKEQKNILTMFGFYLLIPILILAIVGIFKPMYTERYLSHIAIGGLMYVFLVLFLYLKNRPLNLIRFIFFVVIFAGFVQLVNVGNFNFQRLQKPDIKNLVSSIDNCDGSDVIAADPYVYIELSYYLNKCNLYFYSTQQEFGGGYAPVSNSRYRISDINLYTSSHKSFYYVNYDKIKLEMPSGANLISSENYGNMQISKYIVQ